MMILRNILNCRFVIANLIVLSSVENQKCANQFYVLSVNLQVSNRIISDEKQLMSIALDCVYALTVSVTFLVVFSVLIGIRIGREMETKIYLMKLIMKFI